MALRMVFSRNLGGIYSLYYCIGTAMVPRAAFSGCHNLKSADDGDVGKKSVNMEQMINNLGLKLQKKQNLLKFQEKQTLKFKEQMPVNNNLKKISDVRVIKKRRQVYVPTAVISTKEAVEDEDADRQITDLMNADLIDDSLILMEKLAIDNRFPSRKCLLVLVSKCAARGNIEGVGRVREVCLAGFSQELGWQYEYRHYEAEALWKSGSINESLNLFHSLYVKHETIRRKVVNMSSFCFAHVITENLSDHFPNLLNFVNLLANYELFPAANLWRHAFCSNLFETQKIAEKLLDTYPKLPALVKRKISTILKASKENFNADLFQRLMTLAIRFQWDDSYETIFGEYLDYLCLMNDVNGVKETLKYLDTFSMPISASRMEQCMTFIAQSKNSSFSVKKILKGGSAPIKSAIKFEF